MDKLNLTPTINLQRRDKDGKCAVRIRSTIKRKVTYYPTSISVFPDQFKNREIVKHPNKIIFNTAIRNKMYEIERDYLEGKLTGKSKNTDFYAFSQKKITQQKGKDSVGTWKHKKSYLNKLQEFKPVLHFSDVTPSFMLDLENYCRAKGNKPTTVWSTVKFIKTMINAALNDEVISSNPLKGYKGKAYVNPERQYLTDEEIEKIENFAATSKNKTLVKVSYWFLFGVFSGLRYADIKNFDKKKIIDGRIILRTGKSDIDVSIKIHPKLKNVLDKISPDVFTNQKMNDYLKHIAIACGIEKNLTMHIGRHTHAVYFLNHGGSMETLSKLLGHSKIGTTLIYGRITNQRIDSEVDRVWS